MKREKYISSSQLYAHTPFYWFYNHLSSAPFSVSVQVPIPTLYSVVLSLFPSPSTPRLRSRAVTHIQLLVTWFFVPNQSIYTCYHYTYIYNTVFCFVLPLTSHCRYMVHGTYNTHSRYCISHRRHSYTPPWTLFRGWSWLGLDSLELESHSLWSWVGKVDSLGGHLPSSTWTDQFVNTKVVVDRK